MEGGLYAPFYTDKNFLEKKDRPTRATLGEPAFHTFPYKTSQRGIVIFVKLSMTETRCQAKLLTLSPLIDSKRSSMSNFNSQYVHFDFLHLESVFDKNLEFVLVSCTSNTLLFRYNLTSGPLELNYTSF